MPFTAAEHRAYRKRLRASGICTICRKTPARPGVSKCEACSRRNARNNKMDRARWVADPYRCSACGKSVPMGCLCERCRASKGRATANMVARRRDACECVRCGTPVDTRGEQCGMCRRDDRERQTLWRALRV